MANTMVFNEGAQYLGTAGLPATCRFLLSMKGVDAGTAFADTDTLGGGGAAEISDLYGCSGYARGSQSRPAMVGHTDSFTTMTWTTGTATNWPPSVRSIVLVTTADDTGHMIAAANLQTGGAARDMSHANTTEAVTPTLTIVAGN